MPKIPSLDSNALDKQLYPELTSHNAPKQQQTIDEKPDEDDSDDDDSECAQSDDNEENSDESSVDLDDGQDEEKMYQDILKN